MVMLAVPPMAKQRQADLSFRPKNEPVTNKNIMVFIAGRIVAVVAGRRGLHVHLSISAHALTTAAVLSSEYTCTHMNLQTYIIYAHLLA